MQSKSVNKIQDENNNFQSHSIEVNSILNDCLARNRIVHCEHTALQKAAWESAEVIAVAFDSFQRFSLSEAHRNAVVEWIGFESLTIDGHGEKSVFFKRRKFLSVLFMSLHSFFFLLFSSFFFFFLLYFFFCDIFIKQQQFTSSAAEVLLSCPSLNSINQEIERSKKRSSRHKIEIRTLYILFVT